MADLKISQLPAATTPLTGAETIPLVQSGATKKVAVLYVGMYGPAFSAYQNVGQALSSNVWTKIQLQVEEFDTNSAFDNVTNYRFQPQTAGYYQLNANIAVAAAGSAVQVGFYKNGSLFKAGGNQPGPTMYANNCSAIIYLNGSTDYIEMYARFSVGQNSEALQTSTWMNGSLVRSA